MCSLSQSTIVVIFVTDEGQLSIEMTIEAFRQGWDVPRKEIERARTAKT